MWIWWIMRSAIINLSWLSNNCLFLIISKYLAIEKMDLQIRKEVRKHLQTQSDRKY